jgi:hypothetical protein
MPVITVYGTPPNESEEVLKSLLKTIVNSTVSVEELGITEDDISVFFPPDRVKEGLGEEIIVFVDGLFEDPKRTQPVQNKLAREICYSCRIFFRKALVEVFVRSFNPAQGFWSSKV